MLCGGHGRRTEEYEVNNNEARKEGNEICIVLGCGSNAQGESGCWSRAGPGWTVGE